MRTRLLFIHALSPLHAGTGQAVGAIDLPIARERPTGIPLVPGSSIKGALRALAVEAEPEGATPNGKPRAKVLFGPETADSSEHSGAVQISDAHLVLLPVRSLSGTFAWVTSPYLLSRLARDAHEAGTELEPPPEVAAPESCLVLGPLLSGGGERVVLEDLDFVAETASPDSILGTYAQKIGAWLYPETEAKAQAKARGQRGRQALVDRLCLVHDDVMAFLLETATEVAARIRLDPKTKTVARGALWYEEALPTETVLCGLAVASRVRRGEETWSPPQLLDRLAELAKGLVQLGGKATVGRGSCLVHLPGGPA